MAGKEILPFSISKAQCQSCVTSKRCPAGVAAFHSEGFAAAYSTREILACCLEQETTRAYRIHLC